MDLSHLLQANLMLDFSLPEKIHSLGFFSKLYASLVTTVMGMGITFFALVILLFTISLMRKLAVQEDLQQASVTPISPPVQEDDAEIVAAITVAIAETMQTNRKNIVIRSIRRVNDFQPQWNRAGIQNQLNSSLNL